MHANDAPLQGEWQRRWASDPRWPRDLVPAVILAMTFLAYLPTLALGFVFDDHVLIVTNNSIHSWGYFSSYFASHIWSFRYPHLLSNAYRPFFLIWLRLNDMFFGRHVWGWHLSLVVVHVAVTYLVYCLSIRLTRDPWIAAAGALIFGLHPVHVETIAEAAWADQPLSTFFYIGGHSRVSPDPRVSAILLWSAAILGFTGAALLSKKSGLMLPILVSGYVWIYGGGANGEEAGPVQSQAGNPGTLCVPPFSPQLATSGGRAVYSIGPHPGT